MSKSDVGDLLRSFRNVRNQEEVTEKRPLTKPLPFDAEDDKKKFLRKLTNLTVDIIMSFTPQELIYYFQEVAKRQGVKYVIANMKRDIGVFKILRKKYDNMEICLMIEFLFESEQNYIDKATIQPTVLTSTWCNKIYSDAVSDSKGTYVPDMPKEKSAKTPVMVFSNERSSFRIRRDDDE